MTNTKTLLQLTETLRKLHEQMAHNPQHYADNLLHEAQLRGLIATLLQR